MKYFTKLLSKFIFVFLLLSSTDLLGTCVVSGPINVCENQTYTYSTPSNPGETYVWNATGGGTVLGSGNSISVAWTNTGTGAVTLAVKNNLNVVICTFVLNVTIHGKPNPVITPSFLSGCGGRKDVKNDKEGCLVACDSTSIAYTTPFHAGSTYTWTVVGSANYSSSSNTLNVYWTGVGNGSIKVIETNVWGCSKETEICIEIVGKPKAAFYTLPGITGGVVNACLGQTIQFIDQSSPGFGSPINSWSWYFGDGENAFYNSPGNGNTSHAYSSPGIYNVMLVVENECKCKDTSYILVEVANSVGPKIFCISTVCPDATVTYSTDASGCNNYLWTVTNGLIIGSNTNSTVIVQWGNVGPGSITLSVNCPGFCNAPTTVFVPIITPNATINGPSQVCIGSCYTYHISCDIPIDSIEWHFPPGVTVNMDSVNVHEVEVCFYNYVSGNITVNYWHNTPGSVPPLNCGGSSSIPVAVKPQMFMSGASQICANQSYNYTISPSPTGSIYWSITNSSGSTIYTSSTITGSSPFTGGWTWGPGEFIITANDVSGNYCNGPIKKYLTVNPIPPIVDSLYGPSPICPNNSNAYFSIPTSPNYFVGWQVTNGSPSIGIGNTLSITWGPSGPYSINALQIDPVTGCKSAAVSMTVLSTLPLTPTPIIGNDTVCANSTGAYSTTAPGDDFVWSINPSIAGSVASGQHSPNINVQWNNYNGNAYLVVQRKICGSSRKDSILILVNGPTIPTITSPPGLCQGSTLAATSSTASSYLWNFGDGGTSTSNPGTHVYNSPGNYTITLTVAYGSTCPGTAIRTKTISIWPKPNINISTPNPNLYCNPPISTTMTIAAPPSGVSFQWYNPSLIPLATNTSYTATATGNFFVVGLNSFGCKDTSNIIPISTGNCPSACKAAPYTLTWNKFRKGCNTDSFNAVISAGVINLSWNFDDPYNPSSGSGTPVMHTFTEPGYYRVKLCADVPNTTGTGYCNVCMYKVDTIKYVPSFFDSTYCKNFSDSVKVKLVNTTKVLSGYPAPTYSWVVNPGGYTSSIKNPLFTLDSGVYTINLTVAGVCTYTKTITINPLTNASFTVVDSVCKGTPVLFNNTSSGTALSFNWAFGDAATSLILSPVRSYTNAGTYTATLTIINAYGCTDTAKRKVVVLPNTLLGLIMASGPLKLCEGDSVKLNAIASGGYPAYKYFWSSLDTTQFVWAKQTGNYNVEFTDRKGCYYLTGNTNVLVKTSPHPNIMGPKDVCKNQPYSFVANYPNLSSANFSWLLDGVPQYVNNNTINIGMYSMSSGPHQLVVNVMSPDTCYGTDTFIFTLHPNPNVNIVASATLCAGQSNLLVANSTSTNLMGFYWSNGQVNDSIYVGAANIYTVTAIDTFGCKAQASTVVNPLPDLCGMVVGCYEICDTVRQLVWYAPPGYASYQWLYNGNPIPGATSDTIHIPLYQSGVYTVKITSAAGCGIVSEDIKIDFVKCGGCKFNVSGEIKCAPVDELGYQTYSLTLNINNSLGAGANLSITSLNGTVSSISPSILAAGMNTVSATFTDVPPIDNLACFNIVISNQNQICDTTYCIKVPPCGNKNCKLSSKITKFDCAGTDANGNPQYYVCMDVVWGGSTGSTLTLSSSTGNFVNNPVTINNGLQNICYTYNDIPPLNTVTTIYLYAYDPATGLVCKDSFKREYKPCPKDSCKVGVYGLCAHCEMEEKGNWTYDVDLTVMNPFAGNATVTILPITAGTFSAITPNPVAPGLQNISTQFTDLAPSNSIICFKVLLTEVSSGRSCWSTVCLALPPCDSMSNILVNIAENYTLMVYPNPAADYARINYDFNRSAENISFVVRDVRGREIEHFDSQINSGEILINTSDYAAGLYFIDVIKDGRHVGNTKLMVLRN